MFQRPKDIHARPEPFAFYTAEALWTDEHTSKQMLSFHLNESLDVSSRNHAFIDRSAAWIVSYFKVDSDTAIADFGCGPGLYTSRLAQTRASVTGIDFSERSIHYAKDAAAKQNLDITYIQQNYFGFVTDKRFDLILMIMCDFCALSPEQRKILLQKFHRFLKPGGRVLMDVYTLNAFEQRRETAVHEKNLLDGFWSADDYDGYLNTYKYENEKVSLDKYTIIEENRTRVVYNWLQYYSPESLRKELTENGFAVEHFFADVAGAPFDSAAEEMTVVAVKS